MARLLLDHGANVNAQTRNHCSALRNASYNGHFEAVRLLLERGANVDIRDANGQTPRQIAIQVGRRRIIELLSDFKGHSQGSRGDAIQVRFDSYASLTWLQLL